MVHIDGVDYRLEYQPGESRNNLFGGNSNWRGPVWMPMNYLIINSLLTLHDYFGESLVRSCPTRSKNLVNLKKAADDISLSLVSLFQKNAQGNRPVNGECPQYKGDPHFKDLILFFEYFHGENGKGLGASHQTGWTGLIAHVIDRLHD